MSLNKNLLRSKMALFNDTNVTLAEAIKLSPQRFSAKINETDGAEFSQSEISVIYKKYRLSSEELCAIFFATKVS